MLLTKIRNSTGPSTLLWGTPKETGNHSEHAWPMHTRCLRLECQERIQCWRLPLIPSSTTLSKSRSCGPSSKALCISNQRLCTQSKIAAYLTSNFVIDPCLVGNLPLIRILHSSHWPGEDVSKAGWQRHPFCYFRTLGCILSGPTDFCTSSPPNFPSLIAEVNWTVSRVAPAKSAASDCLASIRSSSSVFSTVNTVAKWLLSKVAIPASWETRLPLGSTKGSMDSRQSIEVNNSLVQKTFKSRSSQNIKMQTVPKDARDAIKM